MGEFLAWTIIAVVSLLIIDIIIIVCAAYNDDRSIDKESKHILISIMSFIGGFLTCLLLVLMAYGGLYYLT